MYKKKSRKEIYNINAIFPHMYTRHIKVRESRDSEEHPNSYLLCLVLDQTGSMGIIPETLIKEILPDIIQDIIDAGIKDIQVNFILVGDCDTGRELAPLQVGQAESSDSLMEKWLTSGYLEGLGGGNGFESVGEEFVREHYINLEEPTNLDTGHQGKFKIGMFSDRLLRDSYVRSHLDNYARMYNVKYNAVVTHMDCAPSLEYIDTLEYGIMDLRELFTSDVININNIYVGTGPESSIENVNSFLV